MARIAVWTSFLLILGEAQAPAGEPIKLAWKFAPGDRFYIERTIKQKQKVEAQKKTFAQDSTSRWLSSVEVKEKTAAGFVLALQIEEVERTVVDFPSKKTITDKMGERMKGAKFTLTLAPTGSITKLEGYEEFIKQLMVGQKADLEKVTRSMVSEQILQDSLEEVFAWVAPEPVKVGAKWTREIKEAIPQFGQFAWTYNLVFEGEKEGRPRVNADLSLRFLPAMGNRDLLKVLKSDVQAEEATANYVMAANGKGMDGAKKVAVKGALLVEAGGNQTTLNFRNESALTMRVFTQKEKTQLPPK